LMNCILLGQLNDEQWQAYVESIFAAVQTGLPLQFFRWDQSTNHDADQSQDPQPQRGLLQWSAGVWTVAPHAHPGDIEVAIAANPQAAELAGLLNLKLVQSLWAGVEKLIGAQLIKPTISLCRMVDPSMTETMAETACTHVLWLHRQMHRYRQHQLAQSWEQLPQVSAAQRTVLIVGMGELGTACGKALEALGFNVLGYRRSNPDRSVTTSFAGLNAYCGQADIVLNLLPLTAQTEMFFSLNRFLSFKRGASFINLARGRHVDERALQKALEEHLDHAILDVFSVEPLPKDHWLWSHPKVSITPHVAADTRPETAGKVVAENLRRFFSNEPLLHRVDVSAGY
jgi:glyoxylate/hydroxypyruvate reductase